jgi:hypothetical protein
MNFASSTRRAAVAIKEGRGSSAIKRRIKPALGRLARAVARQPVLRRCAVLFLGLAPGLKPRLRHLMHSGPAAITSIPEISPAARRIYRRLKRQQDVRKAD